MQFSSLTNEKRKMSSWVLILIKKHILTYRRNMFLTNCHYFLIISTNDNFWYFYIFNYLANTISYQIDISIAHSITKNIKKRGRNLKTKKKNKNFSTHVSLTKNNCATHNRKAYNSKYYFRLNRYQYRSFSYKKTLRKEEKT